MPKSPQLMARVKEECRSDYHSIVKRYLVLTGVFALGVLIMRPGWGSFMIWFLVGFITWNVIEYIIHRWAFHTNVTNAPWNHLTYGLHMYHHGHAEEVSYIPVPWRFSSVVMCLVLGGIGVLAGSIAAFFAAGMSLGLSYLYFEWIHRRIHTVTPESRLSKFIHSYHLHHHYGSDKQNFGLTFPFIDILLKTANLTRKS